MSEAIGIDLSKVKMIPGVVLSHEDPKNMQRVKAYVPGLFDPKTMSTEAMPWIYPLSMKGFQSFSLQNQNTKIWVIILPNNPYLICIRLQKITFLVIQMY